MQTLIGSNMRGVGYLDIYNGDSEYDTWVDLDNCENAGTPDVFDEPDFDKFIDNFNVWD